MCSNSAYTWWLEIEIKFSFSLPKDTWCSSPRQKLWQKTSVFDSLGMRTGFHLPHRRTPKETGLFYLLHSLRLAAFLLFQIIQWRAKSQSLSHCVSTAVSTHSHPLITLLCYHHPAFPAWYFLMFCGKSKDRVAQKRPPDSSVRGARAATSLTQWNKA